MGNGKVKNVRLPFQISEIDNICEREPRLETVENQKTRRKFKKRKTQVRIGDMDGGLQRRPSHAKCKTAVLGGKWPR